jgi:hypothetical protein
MSLAKFRPSIMINWVGSTLRIALPTFSAAIFQSVVSSPLPQVGFYQLSQFFLLSLISLRRSFPITIGSSLYWVVRLIRTSSHYAALYLALCHSPSPSVTLQHHIASLLWLLRITIKPAFTRALTVISNTSIDFFPFRLGLAFTTLSSTTGSTKYCASENGRRMQLNPSLAMSCAISSISRRSSPLTTYYSICAPYQFTHANLTSAPFLSTILDPFVSSGKLAGFIRFVLVV